MIGEDIRVTVREKRKKSGSEVRLLIEAPTDILIRRSELCPFQHAADTGFIETDSKP